MEFLVYGGCLFACALQFVLGAGVTFLTRSRLPRGAYFLGFIVPVLVPVVLWFLYTQFSSAQPCPPGVVSCGEADAYVFLLLGGVLLLNLGASAMLQFILWMLERRGQRLAEQNPPRSTKVRAS
jgi:hypothetical protein